MSTTSLARSQSSDTTSLLLHQPEKITAESFRVSLGAGVGSLGLGFSLSLAYDFAGTFVAARHARTDEFRLFGPRPTETVSDFGIICGRSFRQGEWYESVGTGLSYVHTVERGGLVGLADGWFSQNQYENVGKDVIGIPVQVEISLAPWENVGAALIAFANINSAWSVIGLTLNLQFGLLR